MDCEARLHEVSSELEKLRAEHDVLTVSARDSSTTNESVIRELRRLLEKETNLVTILNSELAPDPMRPACNMCAKNYAQVRSVREANAAEYRFVVHFHKTARNLQLELQAALAEQKAKHMQLKAQFDELAARKLDPLSRDAEILRLRDEAQEARRNASNANQTALMANRVADALHKELQAAQQRAQELETEKSALGLRVAGLEEAVDAYKRAGELGECTVSECRDYVCRKRVIDEITKQKALCEQIRLLQQENTQCQNTIYQLRREAAEAPAEPPRKLSKVPPPKTIVANLATASEELAMNLRSFFTVFPGWAEEEACEVELFDDFVKDIAPSEREKNLRWMAEACGVDVGTEELSASKTVRRCFSACLRAIGGLSRKRGSRVVWCNVRRNRAPIFAKDK